MNAVGNKSGGATAGDAKRAGSDAITAELIETIATRVAQGKRVRRTLPIWGRVHVDRPLPFLCVYRRPAGGSSGGLHHLVTSEAAYVIASGAERLQPGLGRLVRRLGETLVAEFGAFLLLEIWEGPAGADEEEEEPEAPGLMTPCFRIVVPRDEDRTSHALALRKALSGMRIARHPVHVDLVRSRQCWPEALGPILSNAEARKANGVLLGLEIRPIYRDPSSGERFPLVLRAMERTLTRALRRCFYDFSCSRTTHSPDHYDMLGRRAVVKAVWEVDHRLAEVSNRYDFLLQVTPVNAAQAWKEFKRERYETAPSFRYRPLRFDPVVLKRELYEIPIERVEDPVLLGLFREKQAELDRQLSMLLELDTPRFAQTSVLRYGGVSDKECRLARQVLEEAPTTWRAAGPVLDLQALVRLAEKEIEIYRQQLPDMKAPVKVRGDIAGGFMVSRGALLVSRTAGIRRRRAEALLHHEVGTHLLTYFNGAAQPFRQLTGGLAGYEALQEGLAVLAEHLAGGLSGPRLRILAARVLAVRSLLQGASFVETFRDLVRRHGFGPRSAYGLTMRVYRGGGLTKDAIYLRGLAELLKHLGGGGNLELLFLGKMALSHLPVIRELRYRGVLCPAPLRPRFLDLPGAAERMARIRAGVDVRHLLERRS